MVSLNEVFEKADIISINATYTPENVNMITSEQLNKLKPNAIIVNTARQELINKEDLYNAIIENKVSSVAMDGFYKEPITDETNDDYLKLSDDKFIITPHNAYNSKDAVFEMERMLTESLLDVLNNKEIRNRVSV
jgi:D-3-phosphoglycerate dehydrogenase